MPQLKVCGINDAAFAVEAARRGVDYLGLIFADGSPRRVTPALARDITASVGRLSAQQTAAPHPRFVGVFVKHPIDQIATIASHVGIGVIQLHGDYGADEIAALKAMGYEVWRLLDNDAECLRCADAVLIDGRDGTRCGGTGRRADWSAVPVLKQRGHRVVLAGGISAANIASAAATGADIIDVNSSIESSPGVKSLSMLNALLTAFTTTQ